MALGKKIASLYAEIGADTKGLDKGLKDSKKGLEGAKQSLGAVAAEAATAAGVLVAFGLAAKQAFDLGREGASITQTRDSFYGLAESVGASETSLEDIIKATNGTIDEMTAMSGVLTLTAGASDAFALSLFDASPRLAEIAKAANKLNPRLGTTAEQFNSISLGIKRQSPLILDYLGILVKAEVANKNMAAALGKTVEQLTAEEKQMAFLNATMEAGNKLIEQAGGTAESAADSYAQLEVATKQISDQFKEWTNEAILPAVSALATLITASGTMGDAFAEQNDTLLTSTGSYEEYLGMLVKAAMASGVLSAEEAALINTTEDLIEVTGAATEKEWLLAQMMDTSVDSTEFLDAAQEQLAEQMARSRGETDLLAGSTGELSEKTTNLASNYGTLTDAMLFNSVAAGLDKDAQDALAVSLGLTTEAELEFNQAIAELSAMHEAGAISADIQAAAILRLRQELENASGNYSATFTTTQVTRYRWENPSTPSMAPTAQDIARQRADMGGNAAGGYDQSPFIAGEGGGPEMVIPGPGGASVITAGMTKIINDRAQSGGISRDDMASMLNSQADRFALVLSDQMAMVG